MSEGLCRVSSGPQFQPTGYPATPGAGPLQHCFSLAFGRTISSCRKVSKILQYRSHQQAGDRTSAGWTEYASVSSLGWGHETHGQNPRAATRPTLSLHVPVYLSYSRYCTALRTHVHLMMCRFRPQVRFAMQYSHACTMYASSRTIYGRCHTLVFLSCSSAYICHDRVIPTISI